MPPASLLGERGAGCCVVLNQVYFILEGKVQRLRADRAILNMAETVHSRLGEVLEELVLGTKALEGLEEETEEIKRLSEQIFEWVGWAWRLEQTLELTSQKVLKALRSHGIVYVPKAADSPQPPDLPRNLELPEDALRPSSTREGHGLSGDRGQ